MGSATRLDNISDAVTHVIVGDPSKAAAELKLIKSKGLRYNCRINCVVIRLITKNVEISSIFPPHLFQSVFTDDKLVGRKYEAEMPSDRR